MFERDRNHLFIRHVNGMKLDVHEMARQLNLSQNTAQGESLSEYTKRVIQRIDPRGEFLQVDPDSLASLEEKTPEPTEEMVIQKIRQAFATPSPTEDTLHQITPATDKPNVLLSDKAAFLDTVKDAEHYVRGLPPDNAVAAMESEGAPASIDRDSGTYYIIPHETGEALRADSGDNVHFEKIADYPAAEYSWTNAGKIHEVDSEGRLVPWDENKQIPDGGLWEYTGKTLITDAVVDRGRLPHNPHHDLTTEHEKIVGWLRRLWTRWRQQDKIDSSVAEIKSAEKRMDILRSAGDNRRDQRVEAVNRIESLENQLIRAQFLLAQAPMRMVPRIGVFQFLRKSVTKYAYIHPRTLAEARGYSKVWPATLPTTIPGAYFATLWVPTDLMPEGCVIFSPNPLPTDKGKF